MMTQELVYNAESKERLDKYLTAELHDCSRTQIQKLIKGGKILVNGSVPAPHHFLKKGDRIVIEQNGPAVARPARPPLAPEIIEQTEDYLVINKPAGLIVHPAPGVLGPTLADWLKENFPQVKKAGENSDRPGIVHRLDRDVSGVMVVALTPSMFASLKEQFQSHTVFKEYLTLVHGAVLSEEAVIDFPLQRSKLSGKIVARARGAEGKESITSLVVSQRFSRYTYLKVAIQTGRTHQIRSHLQAYGHPIVGDSLYQNKKIKDNSGLKRLFLHAHLLRFQDLSGQSREFRAPLPLELKDFLDTLS